MSNGLSPEDRAYFSELLLGYRNNRVPLSASFELTHRCNLKCTHCYQGDQDSIRQHRNNELSTEEAKRILDEIAEAGTISLFFTGGDPMVRKDFREIYTHAVKLGIIVDVFCDGILITDRIIETFRQYPPFEVEISIYGATAETYESVTQVKGSYQRFIRGIDRLRDNNIRYRLKTVLLTSNQHEFLEMEDFARQRGVEFHHDAAVFPCLPHDDNAGAANSQQKGRAPISISVDSIKKLNLDEPLNLRVETDTIVDLELGTEDQRQFWASQLQPGKEFTNTEKLYQCGAANNGFHIDPYGMLYACLLTSHHGHDLKQSSFMDGWNGALKHVQQLTARPESGCNSCELAFMCTGCPALFELETGAPDVKSDYICELTHKRYEQLKPYLDSRATS